MCGPVGLGAGSDRVRRALDAEAAVQRRGRCVKRAAINAAVLLVLAADLSYKCEGYMSTLHWVELGFASIAGANLLRLVLALASPKPAFPDLGPEQCRLLGLSSASVSSISDSSSLHERSHAESFHSASQLYASTDDLSLSLSPTRTWRHIPQSVSPPPSPEGSPERPRDIFIADRNSLAEYLREYEERRREEASPPPVLCGPRTNVPPPPYQLAALDAERGGEEGGASAIWEWEWARLHLDPQSLTQFNLNLRVWLHVTILERLVREMASVDAALARAGLGASLGEVAVERLKALTRAPNAPPSLAQLLPFLEPFANQRYVVKRIRTLATGGALSEYKWNGGGAGWDESDPTDAELVLHLFGSYLDAQLPGATPPLRPFTSKHVSHAPQTPPRDLAIHRVCARPPHYVLILQGETIEVSRGRNNLLHTLLVLIAAAAREQPPALSRLHLGPAGLNLLWIIGR